MKRHVRLRQAVLMAVAIALGTFVVWHEITWFRSSTGWDYAFSLAVVTAVAAGVEIIGNWLGSALGKRLLWKAALVVVATPTVAVILWHGIHALAMISFDQDRQAWTSVWCLAMNEVSGRLALGGATLFASAMLVRR